MYPLVNNIFIRRNFLLATAVIFITSVKVCAQNTSSPYSIIGIGDIENSWFNRTSGMANTGIAYRNDRYIILNNPAAVSDLQSQLFIVELSGRGKFVTYSGKSITSNLSGKDFSVERLSVGTRINKWWGTAAGVLPFSTSNYAFSGTKSLQGTNSTLPATYDGSGGVNRYFWVNGFRINKNLSAGINTSFLGGSLTQEEALLSSDLSTALFTTKNIYIRNWYLDYGLQYHAKVSKKWDVNLGATYAKKTALKAQYSALVKDQAGDTLSNRVIKNNFFTLPNTTGFGIALIKDKKLTFLADYRFQDWSSLNIRGLNYSLKNSSRYSVGAEYAKHNEYRNISYETFNLQAGVFYNRSYLDIYNEQLIDKGFTLGAGVNSKRSALSYTFSLEYGTRGSQVSLIKENYASFTIGISYKDFWYTRGKKYD